MTPPTPDFYEFFAAPVLPGGRYGYHVHLDFRSWRFPSVEHRLVVVDALVAFGAVDCGIQLTCGAYLPTSPRPHWCLVTVQTGGLAWYTDPGSGQHPAGISPTVGACLYPPGNLWEQRYILIDDAYCSGPYEVAKTVWHELTHYFGLQGGDHTIPEKDLLSPSVKARMRANVLRAVAVRDGRPAEGAG